MIKCRTATLAAVVVCLLFAAGINLAGQQTTNGAVRMTSAQAVPLSPESQQAIIDQYCVYCHDDDEMAGNMSMSGLDFTHVEESAELAEKMIKKLRLGMMPPAGMPRPAEDTLLAMVETLESNVDEAARAAPDPGGRRFQRLSRAEYERVIHDLLALEVDAGKWLPADLFMGAFDNQSAAQPFSPTVLDSFLRAASEVARLALGNSEAVSSTTKYVSPERVSQHAWDRLEGAPFGTRGGTVVRHDFLADGEYVFQVKTSQGSGNQTAVEDLDISIDGEGVALLMLQHNAGGRQRDGVGITLADLESRVGIQTEPIFVRAGQHSVSAAFVNLIDGPYEDRFSPVGWSATHPITSAQYGITGLTHVTELWITGPTNVSGVSETESRRKIFTCRPTSSEQERPCAESILTELATEAYRRRATQEDVADLLYFYDEGAAREGFEVGVRMGLQSILVSPEFLFRLEREPVNARPGQSYRLRDVELATRLSFFLWAGAPDEELLEVATSGRLSNPAVLERQVERMLEDSRSETLATRFANQWLRLQDVGEIWPQAYLYPDFTGQLADALVRETELLFGYLVEEDRSLFELLDADHTFVNGRLAQHYEIEGVYGDEFRRVQYPDDRRQGVLSHGSVLHLTSMSDRTSPVLRGKWVLEVLLGSPPPPPPENVPAFESSPSVAGGRRLNTRERMVAHRQSPACNSCHRFMDPIGLALDNFDATGRWRVRENMAPLDTSGDFYDGTPIASPAELVDALLARPIPLVRHFTENLLAYSLGRPVEYFDQPTIRAIAREAEANEYHMSSFILGVVKSDAFQMKRTAVTDDSGADH